MKKLLAILLALCLVVGTLPILAMADTGAGDPVTGPVTQSDPEDQPDASDTPSGTVSPPKAGDGSGDHPDAGGISPGTGGQPDAGGNDPGEEPTETYVAQIDDKQYTSLQSAVDAAMPGDTIEILTNISLKRGINIANKSGITIYGGSHTITAGSDFQQDTSGSNTYNSVMKLQGCSNIKIRALSLVSGSPNSKHALDVYGSNGVTLSYVSLYHNATAQDGAPLIINNSTVLASGGLGIYVSEKSWYGINGDDKGGFSSITFENGVNIYGNTTDSQPLVFVEPGTTNAEHAVVNPENAGLVYDSENGQYVPETKWRIAVSAANGSVAVNPSPAAAGDLVTLTPSAYNGYYFSGISAVNDQTGAAIELTKLDNGSYTFTMPDMSVTVTATFLPVEIVSPVYVANTAHGSLSVSESYAKEGTWVYITVKPNFGYRLYDISVIRPSGYEVRVEHVHNNVFRFQMPGTRVTVSAEFVRTTMPFTDVSASQWFYNPVSFVYWNGLMGGVSASQFAPNATTTRAMVVTILYRMAGSPTVYGTNRFVDVPANTWYSDAVTWAARLGIVEGRTASSFDPNAAVSRQELAAMLYRYARARGYSTSIWEDTNILSYVDAGSVSEYAFTPLQWACGSGVITGLDGGRLDPQGSATRAQLATMLYRFYDVYIY